MDESRSVNILYSGVYVLRSFHVRFVSSCINCKANRSSHTNDNALQHPVAGEPEVVVLTRLQIALSREVKGWPLYTIIIALGQVSPEDLCCTKRL